MALHQRTHPAYVDGCYACKVSSVRLGTGEANSATRTRAVSERRLDRDMAAYKRLRRDGLQPPQINGCYVVEREARERFDVEGYAMFAGKPLHEALGDRTGEEWAPAPAEATA